MADFKFKEIKEIARCTPAALVGHQVIEFPHCDIGYFIKSNCNWSYQVKAVIYNGYPVKVVVVFGEIKGKV